MSDKKIILVPTKDNNYYCLLASGTCQLLKEAKEEIESLKADSEF